MNGSFFISHVFGNFFFRYLSHSLFVGQPFVCMRFEEAKKIYFLFRTKPFYDMRKSECGWEVEDLVVGIFRGGFIGEGGFEGGESGRRQECLGEWMMDD